MKTQWFAVALLAVGLGGLSACANTDTQPTPSDTDNQRTGAFALSSEVTTALGDLDVREMRFDFNEVSCTTGADIPGGFSRSVDKDLVDILLPDGLDFSGSPQADLLDQDSKHVASDHYQVVPGDSCYDVETQPLKQNGTASDDCELAQKKNILVEDGRTTEVMLINQCRGASRGGLDVISTLNRPPQVDSLEFERSKFIATCPFEDGLSQQEQQEAQTAREVCVRASDPEEDPLSFEWRATTDQTFTSSITNLGTTEISPGTFESCARVAPSRKGDYGYEVIVRDLNKQGQPIEDILDPAAQSRDNLRFPFYNGKDCRGRTGTILMAMTDFDPASAQKGANNRGYILQPGLDTGGFHIDRLVQRMASWVSPLSDATQSEVAYIIDDESQGRNEHPGDEVEVPSRLNSAFSPTVDEILEPAGGMPMSTLLNPDGTVKYDVVWFSNPGFPVDDGASHQTLRAYLQAGGAIVLQGDDMTMPVSVPGPDLDWDFFTRLQHVDNGVDLDSCGGTLDNNNSPRNWSGDYRAEAAVQAIVGDLADMPVATYNYGDDINQVNNANPSEVIEISDAIYREFDQAGQETCRDERLPISASDPILLP